MKHQIFLPSFERSDDRGSFYEVLNDGQWEALLHGVMNPGAVMGNHYHKRTVVFFYLTSGTARIKTVHVESGDTDEFTLAANQGTMLHPHESHAIYFLEPSHFVMLKSQKYDPADPDTFHFLVPE